MTDYKITAQNLTKIFGRRLVFDKLNFEFTSANVYGISGPNGSGKSTLVKIIANIISPTRGKIIFSNGNSAVRPEDLHNHLGFVSPYLYLYDEFTAEENLRHFSSIRGIKYDETKAFDLLKRVNLFDRKDDLVKGYSSGMKQRMKFIFALLHEPPVVILDEPTSNLDVAGKDTVYDLVKSASSKSLVIIASNETSDLELCGEIINVENFKNKS